MSRPVDVPMPASNAATGKEEMHLPYSFEDNKQAAMIDEEVRVAMERARPAVQAQEEASRRLLAEANRGLSPHGDIPVRTSGDSLPERDPVPSVTSLGIPRTWDASRVRTEIEITQQEQAIFDLLLDINEKQQLGSTLRVAGGWVRDKCLGVQSNDIDIALDNMMGVKFAEKVNEELKLRGAETHSIGVIQANPDQSKHLETATVMVDGLWIDFVHLRTEEYADGSRIPSNVGIGTPLEDTLRRDLTINSLYYNINTREIEDFTGRGMSDLRAGLIVTPLPPVATFLDDPLRVLRTIRFASRFHGAIDEEVTLASQDARVRDALQHKVSRERVGKEMEGCFKVDPIHAFRLAYKMLLYDVIFQLPPGVTIEGHYRYRSLELMAQMDRLLARCNETKLSQLRRADSLDPSRIGRAEGFIDFDPSHAPSHIVGRTLSEEEVRHLLMAAFFSTISGYEFKGKRGRKESAVRYIVEQQLKWSTKDADTIVKLCAGGVLLSGLVKEVYAWWEASVGLNHSAEGAEVSMSSVTDLPKAMEMRRRVGLAIRSVGGLWRQAVCVAAVQDLPGLHFDMLATDQLLHWESLDALDDEVVAALRPYHEFVHVVQALKLDDVLELRPKFDGNQLPDIVGRPERGPWMGHLLESCIEWQLEHPDATDDECKEFLREAAARQPAHLVQPVRRQAKKKPRTGT